MDQGGVKHRSIPCVQGVFRQAEDGVVTVELHIQSGHTDEFLSKFRLGDAVFLSLPSPAGWKTIMVPVGTKDLPPVGLAAQPVDSAAIAKAATFMASAPRPEQHWEGDEEPEPAAKPPTQTCTPPGSRRFASPATKKSIVWSS